MLTVKGGYGMKKSLPCTDEELSEKYDRYGAMLFRMCIVIFCNRQDAEDAVQETFEKYINKKQPEFNDDEHEKAWFIRVAENQCKDKRRAAAFRLTVNIGDDINMIKHDDHHEEPLVLKKCRTCLRDADR